MSANPLRCSKCGHECIFERCAPFGQGQETTYAVAWNCPQGHGSSLDVCPVGPLVPARTLCLNCGAPYASDVVDARCGECGLSRPACPAALGLAQGAHGQDCIASARTAFAQGLFRRGLAILNQALQEKAALVEAWYLKSRFLNSLGFNRTAAEMLEGVVATLTSAGDRIQLLEEQSFLWAECERGRESLACADAASAIGSDSVRTHYLRGRALALLGRLEDARAEMSQVLGRDPKNTDAQRGLNMIEAALHPTAPRRWWQFWRQ
jgi:tetratricopeptide (TPR) repeat protein